jgi:hypothetical protein
VLCRLFLQVENMTITKISHNMGHAFLFSLLRHTALVGIIINEGEK